MIHPEREEKGLYWASGAGAQKGVDSAIPPGSVPVAWIILELPQR